MDPEVEEFGGSVSPVESQTLRASHSVSDRDWKEDTRLIWVLQLYFAIQTRPDLNELPQATKWRSKQRLPCVSFWDVWCQVQTTKEALILILVFCACLGWCWTYLSCQPHRLNLSHIPLHHHPSNACWEVLTKQRLHTIHVISVSAWTKTEIKTDQLEGLLRIRGSLPEIHHVPSLSTSVSFASSV